MPEHTEVSETTPDKSFIYASVEFNIPVKDGSEDGLILNIAFKHQLIRINVDLITSDRLMRDTSIDGLKLQFVSQECFQKGEFNLAQGVTISTESLNIKDIELKQEGNE